MVVPAKAGIPFRFFWTIAKAVVPAKAGTPFRFCVNATGGATLLSG
jgi:hypothetical protein